MLCYSFCMLLKCKKVCVSPTNMNKNEKKTTCFYLFLTIVFFFTFQTTLTEVQFGPMKLIKDPLQVLLVCVENFVRQPYNETKQLSQMSFLSRDLCQHFEMGSRPYELVMLGGLAWLNLFSACFHFKLLLHLSTSKATVPMLGDTEPR